MHQIANFIAENRYLQAVSIVVAVGTLIIFLWKNVPPSFGFLFDIALKGWRVAFYKLLRPMYRRASLDFSDSRLIILSLYLLSMRSGLRLAFLPLFYMMIMPVVILSDRKLEFDIGAGDVLLYIAIFVSAIPVSWFIVRPIYQLLMYVFMCRRLIVRHRRIARRHS